MIIFDNKVYFLRNPEMFRQSQSSGSVRNQISAVQIVEKVGGKYKLKTDKLRHILEKENVLGKKVVVLTVAGAFRKGKSFFLSNCVRYLQNKSDWMSDDAPITGFAWRQSADSVTEGILMWPEPFITENEKGEEVAILLMDTEGAFDHKSSKGECATVFALAALLSSVLVFNVMQDVQEDTLEHLQSLFFLIRDWQNGTEYGKDEGESHLKKLLEPYSSSNESMRTLRTDIKSFTDTNCCLLPHPGNKITGGSEGMITVKDMDEKFRAELTVLIPHLLNKIAKVKEIGGKHITGAEFLNFFDIYVNIFASGNVPEPRSIFDATADATHQSAYSCCLEFYTTTMRKKFLQLNERPYFEESLLETIHRDVYNEAVRKFTETKKMGDLPRFLDALKGKIEESFKEEFLKENRGRIKHEHAEKMRREQEEQSARAIEQLREENARKDREREREREQERERQRERERRENEQALEREAERRREAERQRDEERRRREEAERQSPGLLETIITGIFGGGGAKPNIPDIMTGGGFRNRGSL